MAAADLAPDVAAFLDLLAQGAPPSFRDMAVADARAAVLQMGPLFDAPADPVVDVVEAIVPADGRTIRVRCYTPPDAGADAPAILYFHGGGWMLGDVDSYDSFCSYLARRSGLRVASVDYRRAPETVFPGALDDAAAAGGWLLSGASPFGAVAGLVLAGDSAGGNIAAGLSARQGAGAWPVRALLLFYPVLDVSRQSASYAAFASGFLLDAGDMAYFIENYVPDSAARHDAACSPLLAVREGAPPVSILTCSHDVLRDEGRAYARACGAAGIPVLHVEAAGHVHGIVSLRQAMPSGVAYIDAAIENLIKILK